MSQPNHPSHGRRSICDVWRRGAQALEQFETMRQPVTS
jgi:hypothetical protein